MLTKDKKIIAEFKHFVFAKQLPLRVEKFEFVNIKGKSS